MKIAYVASSILPSRAANSVHVVRMCAAYAGLGHDVTLFVPDRAEGREPGIADIHAYYGVPESFRIVFLPWPKIRFRSLWFGWKAQQAIRRLKPDLVHSRFLQGIPAFSLPGAKLLFEYHVPIWQNSNLEALWLRFLLARGRVTGMVLITHALADAYARRKFFPPGRGHVAPDGGDVPGEVVPVLPPSPGILKVGYIGQLYRGKGMEVVVEVARRMPDVQFHIVGGLEPDIAFWKTKATSNVVFHGFVAPGSVSEYIASMDVCLLPNQARVYSHGTKGGAGIEIGSYTSPLKMFEYMAHGKPILASDLPVLREVLSHDFARLAAPGDPDAWVREVLSLKESPELREKLGRRARAVFEENYTWRRRAEGILEFFDRL